MMMALPASQFYLKRNIRGRTRRLPMGNEVSRKRPLVNGRGRTHSHPMREGRAPENKSSDAVTLSNREGAAGFSKRREREAMIVTGNKSAEFCVIWNRGRKMTDNNAKRSDFMKRLISNKNVYKI